MKRGSQPIRAERVWGLVQTPGGWRLHSTAAKHVFHGPVAREDVPPWTADEWAMVAAMYATVVTSGRDSDGDEYSTSASLLNVPIDEYARVLRTVGAKKLAMYPSDPGMHHGFHAFRGRQDDQYAHYPVTGEVDLFGRVVEYERGYRAQGLRIRKLALRAIPETGRHFGVSMFAAMFEAPRLPQGDESLAPAIVRDLERAYHCEVAETWREHRRGAPRGTADSPARRSADQDGAFWFSLDTVGATAFPRPTPPTRGHPSPVGVVRGEHLQEAASDLLAACEEYVRKVERHEPRSGQTYLRMKAAIAKAHGQHEE